MTCYKKHVFFTCAFFISFGAGNFFILPVASGGNLLRAASDIYDWRPIFNLAEKYYLGQGVSQDYFQARQLYATIVGQRHDLAVQAHAQARLGECYYFGFGVVQNFGRARELFEQARSYEFFRSWPYWTQVQGCLADIYFHGLGIEKNFAQARMLYESVAGQQGDVMAQSAAWVCLGLINYLGGDGVVVNRAQAFLYWRRAADQTYNISARRKAREFLREMDQPIFAASAA
ncbi:hypothetical protein CVU75_03530 [Candidatus Dependentiae bacterium HGW-Dependentiae-1]|nr:MAG: hypothetical protein CVU75_03530 [Candidatus Dependentiae bacterium HGW-Dependentiae-1]